MKWDLPIILRELNSEVAQDLQRARDAIGHPTELGDATEYIWIELFNKYLPKRYEATKAAVVDSLGNFSDQIDVVIHDRQYTPLMFSFKGRNVVPAESVYAVFESKQEMNAKHVGYAQEKARTVRSLHRTSLPVPTIDGTSKAKIPSRIIAGILTLSCAWSPPFGDTMRSHLEADSGQGLLDIGSVADAGIFKHNAESGFELRSAEMPVTLFLFELITLLQTTATVPMIDLGAYGKSLA